MSDLQKVHCRFCGQTFFTTPDSLERCDLCGKSGGLVSPEVAVVDAALRDRQQAAEKVQRQGGPKTALDWVQFVFGMMVAMGAFFLISQPGQGPVTTAFDIGLIILGNVGMLVVWWWRKRRPTPERPEDREAQL
jgi:hypothetical protein